jgi:hypothetical protein
MLEQIGKQVPALTGSFGTGVRGLGVLDVVASILHKVVWNGCVESLDGVGTGR